MLSPISYLLPSSEGRFVQFIPNREKLSQAHSNRPFSMAGLFAPSGAEHHTLMTTLRNFSAPEKRNVFMNTEQTEENPSAYVAFDSRGATFGNGVLPQKPPEGKFLSLPDRH